MSSLFFYILFLIVIIIAFGSAAYAGLRAAPWLPVFKKDLDRILKLARIRDNDLVYDLGSGDGRVVAALAHNSAAHIVGYEISLLLYIWSRLKLLFCGLWARVEIRYADFLTRDLSQATVIFCFLTPMAMKKLAPKFRKELKQGTRIISYSFSLPDWEPRLVERRTPTSIPIFYYEVGPAPLFINNVSHDE
jgi:SAM-dependent methyltransferase